MKGSKQRTTLLAASLAVVVSGGVALQAFAEAPATLRYAQQTEAEAGTLAEQMSDMTDQLAALTMPGTARSGQVASTVSGGAISNALSATLSNLLSDQAAITAPAPGVESTMRAFKTGNEMQRFLAAPVAGSSLTAAMRTSAAERSLFASEPNLASAFDLGTLAAFSDAEAAGRQVFATELNSDQLRAAMRSDGTVESAFASLTAPAELGNLVSDTISGASNGALRAAFAAQTSDAGDRIDSLRFDQGQGASGFLSSQASSLSAPLNLAALAGLAAEVDGDAVLSAPVIGGDDLRAALRSGNIDGGLFAGDAPTLSLSNQIDIDLETLAAALSSDSMEPGALSAVAEGADAALASLRYGGSPSASALYASEVTTLDPHAVDYTSIFAGLAADD